MAALFFILVSLFVADDDTYSVTLTFKVMHCKECEEDLVVRLKKVDGVKDDSIKVNGAAVSITITEKTAFPHSKLKGSCPRDLQLLTISVEVRGTVAESKGKFTLTCKSSNYVLNLQNPEKPKKEDKLGELKKEMGNPNRFTITGLAIDADKLILQTFAKAEWK